MITIQSDVIRPQVNAGIISKSAARAADDISLTVKNNAKIALTRARKIATGKTLRGINAERVLDSPSRGEFRRNVVASRSWFFIVNGRRAGGKLPVVRVAGATKKGGALYMPAPELLEWFQALNIPRAAWFPILRSIAKRGIRPVRLTERALNLSRPRIAQITVELQQRIAEGLLTK